MASQEGVNALNLILQELRTITALLSPLVHQAQSAQPKAIAPDRDLDSQWGDEKLKLNPPRDWRGPSYKGKTMSQAPARYLELTAETYDYFAAKNEKDNKRTDSGKPAWEYDQRSAARARGWAARARAAGRIDVPPGTDPNAPARVNGSTWAGGDDGAAHDAPDW